MLKNILLAAFFSISLASSAEELGGVIDIKGIKIGSTKEEVRTIFGKSLNEDRLRRIDIAGVYGDASELYRDEGLDYFLFIFHPNRFQELKDALQQKYPKISCNKSELSNSMGAKFLQEDCIIKSENATLTLSKYGGNINSGHLNLRSKKFSEEFIEQRKNKKKDI